jgi:N-acetylated-alpha-linked acidic dipeptidase
VLAPAHAELLNQGVAAISGARLMEHIAAFARRTKHAGTPGELESLRYVDGQLGSYGYATDLFHHDAYISLPGAARFEALGAEHPCITHSFSRPASELRVRLVDVGTGDEASYAAVDARGAAVLVDGIATPASTIAARRHGAVAQVHASPHEHLHEMCISPVWGSPGDDQLDELPRATVVTVARETGERLRAALAVGEVVVRLDAAVETGWRRTPILVGDLAGPRGEGGPFVLLSGHHDTWHYGVMDNGGANATMLEVARVCALAREHWRRGLRVAFWSGHSQGRYSSSAWYADTHWRELERRAVAHVNVDSTGGRGNTVVSDTSAAEELAGLAREALLAQAGQEFSGRRTERAGDQSFWGIGVPSIFANMSEQPAGSDVNAMGAVIGSGTRRGAGTGWWWHTPHDTADKIDEEILLRDTRIYQHAVWRLLATPVPPLDFAAAARALVEMLAQREREAGGVVDFSLCLERARLVEERAARLGLAAEAAEDAEADRLAEVMRRLSRSLVPLAYTRGDRFVHDPALAQPPIPALADTALLAALEPDGRRFLASRLVRESNRVAHALDQALSLLETV